MSQTEKQSLTAPTPSGGAAEPLTAEELTTAAFVAKNAVIEALQRKVTALEGLSDELRTALLAARRGKHAARAQLAIANNLLSTFRDHAAIPEVLANDVEEIDAYLAALAATPEGPCDRFPPTDLLPDEDW